MAAAISTFTPSIPLDSKSPAVSTSVELSAPTTPERHEDDELEDLTPRTVDELIRVRARQVGHDAPIVSYPKDGSDYIDYAPAALDVLVEKAAAHYSSVIPQRTTSDDPVEIIGVLGASDFCYIVSFLAISRLGHGALLLSTRITGEAYESLLRSTKATTLLYHEGFAEAARAVQSTLPTLKIQPICDPTTLSAKLSLKPSNLDPRRETKNTSFIIHSSGSTGLPKPILQTHAASLYAYSQHFNLVGHITLPLYHNHGICCFFRAIYSRKRIYIYNASQPLTSKNLVHTLSQHSDIGILYSVPYALKLLSETEAGLRLLAGLEIVMFGGSACPKPLGDLLVSSGVNLVGHYGATEVGQLMTSFRNHKDDKGWDWLRVPAHLKRFLSMEERSQNIFELCVLKGWPSKVATNREDGSYATKDLFEPHPSIPDAWRYYARLDDTITLENGEKANPLLLEGIMRQNKVVAEAVVFGTGKARLGAFVVPAAETELSKNELLDSIMPSILSMNESLPAYAHISRDMMRVLPRDVEYRRTDKGTVIRAAFYKDFADKIDEAYFDHTAGTLVLEKANLVSFLRGEILSKVKLAEESNFGNDMDLFSLGIDSLQAIQIRSFILKNLKLNAASVGRNFVFDFPTINDIANEIVRLQQGRGEEKKASVEERMAAMIDKYAEFGRHVPRENSTPGKYIVLTGATGSLGAHVMAKLASQKSVRKVYCLVRASDLRQASGRVRQSLRERSVYHTLSLNNRAKIVALPSDFSKDCLGLEPEQYQEVAKNITSVLHFAWAVNFNKNLESFEGDCIVGLRNLISLCLKARRPSPATFNFCSSVSATVRTPGSVVPESLPESLSYAQNMGYAQSKLVAEHICDRATSQAGLQTRVVRVGQIIGDTKHGIWNDTEAIPMIFQTARTIGALPELDETPAWLPVDVVADTCIEISSSSAPSGVFNVVNHSSFHWTKDLLPLLKASGLEFETVSPRQWVRRLRDLNPDPVQNPPIKLLDFFASKYDNDSERKSLTYTNEKSQGYSLALQNAGTIDASLIGKIVKQLESTWSKNVEIQERPIAFVIGGACGTGKTRLASSLSRAFTFPMIEGDNMHSVQSRRKMANCTPLDDTDRLAWLAHIRGAIMGSLFSTGNRAVFLTCSALKRAYRDQLRALESIAGIRVSFIMLSTDQRNELKRRLEERLGHYMTPPMVDSQLETFEAAEEDETDVINVNAAASVEEVFEEARQVVADILQARSNRV